MKQALKAGLNAATISIVLRTAPEIINAIKYLIAVSYTHLDVYKRQECDEYYVCDWSGSDYHHSVHTFWKKNQKRCV